MSVVATFLLCTFRTNAQNHVYNQQYHSNIYGGEGVLGHMVYPFITQHLVLAPHQDVFVCSMIHHGFFTRLVLVFVYVLVYVSDSLLVVYWLCMPYLWMS